MSKLSTAKRPPFAILRSRCRRFWGGLIIALALLVFVDRAVRAQFVYSTNGSTVTLTQYTGSGGAVTISNFVSCIGYSAFYHCGTLTSVTIPGSVLSIESEGGPYYPTEGSFAGCTNLVSATIGVGVTSIGGIAFYGCSRLNNLAIPNSVTSFGTEAFSHSGLTSVVIPGSVTSFGARAFLGCRGLTNVTIMDGVTSIGSQAFDYCSGLASVTIPDSVTSIGESAFDNCSSLSSVTIPNGTSIEEDAFFLSGLTSVTIPNGTTSIVEGAFSACYNLNDVVIGKDVADIGDYAFAYCGQLAGVFFLGNAPSADANAFILTEHDEAFAPDPATAYYLPGTTGWPAFSAATGLPVLPWQPTIQISGSGLGVQSNQFGFKINWASGQEIVVEACTNLANPVWTPLLTNTITNGLFYFSEALQTNTSGHYYRIIAP